jgi:MIF4G like
LVSALKAYAAVTREQKSTLARVLECFVHVLHSSGTARRVIVTDAWEGHAGWGDEEWVTWRTWMWYKHFCRVVSDVSNFGDDWLMKFSFTVLTIPTEFCDDPYCRLVWFTGDFHRRCCSSVDKNMAHGHWPGMNHFPRVFSAVQYLVW